jgi:hypothetical protein
MAHAGVGLKVLGNPSLTSTLPVDVRKGMKYPRVERNLNPDWANGYWRTGLPYATTSWDLKTYMAEHQVYHEASDTCAQLEARAKRYARGQPSYDKHNIRKLRLLVQHRAMSTYPERKAQGVKKPNKKQLVEILEAADDAVVVPEARKVFHKFSELPPELRNRVYTYYFKSMGEVPPRFALPPLCKASRQLRLESTGLFFEHCTFIVTLNPWYQEARLHYHTEVAGFNIPTTTFARTKHLHIELRYSPFESPLLDYSVDLTDGQCGQRSRRYPKWEWSEHVQNQRRNHVRDLVKSIIAREGQAKLEKGDLEALEVAVRKDLWLQ